MLITNSFSLFLPQKLPLSLTRLSQMKPQKLVDQGNVNTDTIPAECLNRNRLMPNIQISVNGILKLLNNLKPSKAAGPDSIRPIMLKELRVELAPIIKVILERSL